MTDNKELRTFEELTPTEINDLVATGIMGYIIPADRRENYAKEFHWEGPNIYHYFVDSFNPLAPVVFDAYHSLDDCFLAEEKLDLKQSFAYLNQLALATRGSDFYDRTEGAIVAPHVLRLIHATAQQRTRAMLLAYGLIQESEQ